MVEIAEEVGVSKSSVSVWTADVDFDDEVWAARAAKRRKAAPERRRSTLSLKRERKIAQAQAMGVEVIGSVSDREFLIAGLMLYAGEGFKTNGSVGMANTDPRLLVFFVAWLRHFFEVDEQRLRVRLYLHEGLDLVAATNYWSRLLSIPDDQFRRPYRARADASRRSAKHPMGCPSVRYSCTWTHRRILGLMDALLCCKTLPG